MELSKSKIRTCGLKLPIPPNKKNILLYTPDSEISYVVKWCGIVE